LDVAFLSGKRVATVGKLGGTTKKEMVRLIREAGGRLMDRPTASTEILVVGADQPLMSDWTKDVEPDVASAIESGAIEVLQETELWQRLGVSESQPVKQLYTPAMLADLLQVSVRVVRRWHRMGLIKPVKEVMRLPYFDYQEVATARQLAGWLAEGATVQGIQQQLADLVQMLPDETRSIQQLSIIAEGKRLLLRKGDGLVESTGQMRIDFGALDESHAGDEVASCATISFETLSAASLTSAVKEPGHQAPATIEEMLEQANIAEDEDHLDVAADWYRTALASQGPSADICFQLAELLYRMNDLTAARERYYMALEMNPDLVEARANLGCVLVELGQLDLAVAAFEGTLSQYEDYADVHYHMARTLDELEQHDRAAVHWSRFLELAPSSPWAEEAEERLRGNLFGP
jgi:tetratricopeptide (TPR) repeat protein